jgi:hypothetical protein
MVFRREVLVYLSSYLALSIADTVGIDELWLEIEVR